MAVGDTITAARYNIIRARINAVLGLGAGDEGYGQAVESTTVATGATVTAQHMSNLFSDINKCRVHQTGSAVTQIAEPSVGDTIEDSNTTTKEGYVQYEDISITAQAARLTAAASQLGLESGTSSVTNTNWSSDINHVFTVTFPGYSVTNGDGSVTTISATDHMRVFFNAGGTINLSGSIGSE